MSKVIIKYSTPVYNAGKKLDGTLSSTIRCWHDVAVTIQTHVPESSLPNALLGAAPAGYYLTQHPQITQDPPKLKIYQVTSFAEKYSASGSGFVLERPSGEPAYTG